MGKGFEGVLNRHDAYSKSEVLTRMGVSQATWDRLLNEGLPYASVGHTRWVSGDKLIAHLEKHSVTKGNSPRSN